MQHKQIHNTIPCNGVPCKKHLETSPLKLWVSILTIITIGSAFVTMYLFYIGTYVDGWAPTGKGLYNFLIREFVYAFIATLITLVPIIYTIRRLDLILPWGLQNYLRILVELIAIILIATIGISILFIARIYVYNEPTHYQFNVHVYHVLMAIAGVLIDAIVIEGIRFFRRWKISVIESEIIEKENALAINETIRNQINPNFLFCSLDRLYELISVSKTDAKKFVMQFSNIYRYTIESVNQFIVNVHDELEFVNSYLYLIEIVHGKLINANIKVFENNSNVYIIPSAIQNIIDNLIKTQIVKNKISSNLTIHCYTKELTIMHSFAKNEAAYSFNELKEKLNGYYNSISDLKPEFKIENNTFTATLPYIDPDD